MITSFVFGIFTSKIISVFLGTSGMALMGSFRNFANFSKSTATLGLNNSVIKIMVEHKDNKKELSLIFQTFFSVFIAISVLFSVLLMFLSVEISNYLFFSDGYSNYIKLFALFLPFMIVTVLFSSVLNSFEKYKRIVKIQIVSSVFVFIISTLLIYYIGLAGGIVSIVAGEIVLFLVTYFYFAKQFDFIHYGFNFNLEKAHLKTIFSFSQMAFISAVLIPLSLIVIRNFIVQNYSLDKAGVWDALNRISSFYMMFFGSGLSLYYMPKLASIKTDNEFKEELKDYYKILVPLFLVVIVLVYLCRTLIINFALTDEFIEVKDLMVWQVLGDLLKIMSLAFGFQILVKTMLVRYFVIEIVFNFAYVFLAWLLLPKHGLEGVVEAYFFANAISLCLMLFFFRKLFFTPSS
ncbi:MAG TPA: O-antigen translocase [Flavobacterium lutivivi]|nr:O-antigen translocase [Flavobacterium lutivivi]